MAVPLLAGAVHVRLACWLPAVPATLVGTPGAPYTVADALVAEYALTPIAVRVATRNTYAVPAVRPVTAYVVDVDAVFDVATVHDVPLFEEYSTT